MSERLLIDDFGQGVRAVLELNRRAKMRVHVCLIVKKVILAVPPSRVACVMESHAILLPSDLLWVRQRSNASGHGHLGCCFPPSWGPEVFPQRFFTFASVFELSLKSMTIDQCKMMITCSHSLLTIG